MKKNENLLLLGGGGHCRSCIEVIESTGQWRIIGIVDPNLPPGSMLYGYPVLGGDDHLAQWRDRASYALVTVGQIHTAQVRQRLFAWLTENGFSAATVISSRAYVSPRARIGAGTIVLHDALINAGSIVGENCIVNTKALIEHDCRVGAHCHIATGARVNGTVRIGAGSFIGSGAIVVNDVVLPENSFIRAGELVRRSCAEGAGI